VRALTKESIESIANEALKIAKQIMEGGEELAPVLIHLKDGEPVITEVDMSDDEAKQRLEEGIGMLAVMLQPEIMMLVFEGWRKNPENPAERIGEAITIGGISPHGQFMLVCNYTKDEENKPVWGETVMAHEGVSSRFFNRVEAVEQPHDECIANA